MIHHRLSIWTSFVACLITLLAEGAVIAQSPENAEPTFSDRVLYAPGHFGNSYEVMGRFEMRQLLAEAQFWGFNRYADWFDTVDCSDPFAHHEHTHYQLAESLWERKKANFLSAQSLGMKCDLVITPNHVYVDQCRPDLRATSGDRVFGQLICPSIPEAHSIILKNYEHLFADLAQAGVKLSAICACPYDYGGCRCDKCDPWILTYAELCREIYGICRRYHPEASLQMIGWWWTPDEHRLFAQWIDSHMPGEIERMYLHIPYGSTRVADVLLPKQCQQAAFVHIGYADQAAPKDVYGHLGPVIAPKGYRKP